MKCKKYRGSYTIEASLLMPIVLGIILLIIYLSIYIHDKAIIEYEIVNAGLNSISCDREILGETDIRNELEDNIHKHTFGRWNIDITVDEDIDGRIYISVEGLMGYSQGLIRRLITEKLFYVKTSSEYLRVKESEWIKAR